MNKSVFGFLLVIVFGCSKSYEARESMSDERYQQTIAKIAPYVAKKHDEMSYEDRFKPESAPYFKDYVNKTEGTLQYFLSTDTAKIFYYTYKDKSSLFEHYRGFGGYYREDEDGKITFLNILYHTPRLTREEQAAREYNLFHEMVTTGSVEKYLGNREYVHVPNEDFFYNTTTNRWDYTANSSWKFLEEERKLAGDSVSN